MLLPVGSVGGTPIRDAVLTGLMEKSGFFIHSTPVAATHYCNSFAIAYTESNQTTLGSG